ncbi:MAG: hypothetical protein IPG59_15245 [Candidatus Melainabacteria bacterium]|nr:MAG: hypothetical protein IPG59_15245 [Candidatus Melainabacteria bacterium]
MERKLPSNQGPIRELEWLAQYFAQHGKDDMAHQIFEEVKRMRKRLREMRLRSGQIEKGSGRGTGEQE